MPDKYPFDARLRHSLEELKATQELLVKRSMSIHNALKMLRDERLAWSFRERIQRTIGILEEKE